MPMLSRRRDSAGQEQGDERRSAARQELLTTAKDRFGIAKTARAPYEPDWFVNMAFFVGDQWVYWNRGHLERPRFDTRDPVTDNRIQGIVNTRIARKTKSKPSFIATPTSLDESDVEAARLTDQVLESDWEELHLTKKMYGALNWAEICCAGFWKVYYDPSKGKGQDYLMQGEQAVTDDYGAPMRADQWNPDEPLPEGVAPQQIAEGDMCVEVISPFEFFPDPLATSMEDLEWCVEAKVRSVDYVRERYGVKVEPDTDAPMGVAESRMTGFNVLPGISGASGDAKKYRGVKVYEFWSKPSPDFPNGIKICWARDTVLHTDEAPFDPIPYVMFGAQDVPGRFWPTTITTQLRGPQTQLNRTKTQIYENLARIGNPALLWNRYAGKVTYKGLPGETIVYDGGVPDSIPRYLDPPELPVYLREEVQRIESAMQEIAGLHEVSKATVPSGVTAASAINLLQEADDTRLGPEVAATEHSIAEAGRKLIRARAAYTDVPRMIRLAGEDGDWDIQEWKGVMLGEGVGVSVQAGSMMPRSKAAKQAAMMEVMQTAMQYGLPLQPRNIRRFFKDYEVGGIDKLFVSIAEDEQQITWENRQLSMGAPLQINSFDNDDLHIEGHEEYCKTGRWRRLPDEAKQNVLGHIDQHRQRRIAQKDAQVQAMMQEAQGGMQAQAQQEVAVEAAKVAMQPPTQNGSA